MTVATKVLFICDVHVPDQHDDAVLLCLDYAKKAGCNRVVIGGDLIDLYPVSSFTKNPGAPSLREEIDATKPLLKLFVEEFGETTYLAGNHERRLQHYLWTNAAKLSVIEEVGLPRFLGLPDIGVRFIDNISEMSDNRPPFSIGSLYYLHGDEGRVSYGVINPAKVMLERTHESVIFGHFHKTAEHTTRSIAGVVRGAWSVGTLGPLTPAYQPLNGWNRGFAVITHYSDGYFEVDNKKVLDRRVV